MLKQATANNIKSINIFVRQCKRASDMFKKKLLFFIVEVKVADSHP